MRLRTPYKVKCEVCGETVSLDLQLECVGSYNRRMGPEMEFIAEYEDACPNCGSDILVRVAAWEYPEGHLRDHDVMTEGALPLKEPEFIMED